MSNHRFRLFRNSGEFRKLEIAAAVALFALGNSANAQTKFPAVNDAISMMGWSNSALNYIAALQATYALVNNYRGSNGINVWTMGSMNFPRNQDYTGAAPRAFTAGFDVQDFNGWTLGLNISDAAVHGALSDGGNFKLNGVAITGSAYYSTGVWIGILKLGIIGTVAKNYYQINRTAVADTRVFNNNASTEGNAYNGTSSFTYTFTERWFYHGPNGYITTNMVSIDPYSEAGSILSRKFTEQSRVNSLGNIGYSAYFNYLKLQPYASVNALYILSNSASAASTSLLSGAQRLPIEEGGYPPSRWSYQTTEGLRVFFANNILGFVNFTSDIDYRFKNTAKKGYVGMSASF